MDPQELPETQPPEPPPPPPDPFAAKDVTQDQPDPSLAGYPASQPDAQQADPLQQAPQADALQGGSPTSQEAQPDAFQSLQAVPAETAEMPPATAAAPSVDPEPVPAAEIVLERPVEMPQAPAPDGLSEAAQREVLDIRASLHSSVNWVREGGETQPADYDRATELSESQFRFERSEFARDIQRVQDMPSPGE